MGEEISIGASLRLGVVVALLVTACSSGDLPQALLDDLSRINTATTEFLDLEAVERVGRSGDERAAWEVADTLRFAPVPTAQATALVEALETLMGIELDETDPATWVVATNELIIRDVGTLPGHVERKADLYGDLDESYRAFLADPANPFDLRLVGWGGALPDTRLLDDDGPCVGCIPALDHPAVTDAAGGDWYQGHRIVFGVVVDGEARAYPRNMLEVHELVNDTIGGREVAIPYCTLCGAAQAFLVDEGAERLVLRTSGLLHRSNKVMVELATGSWFDTFVGTAITGPLTGTTLTQVPVVTSTWSDWKAAHPDTTIVAEDGGIGRTYDEDPLAGRDANGPVFPVGAVDGRLGSVDRVVGVIAPDGTAVAFPVAVATAGAEAGGIRLVADGSGFRAETPDGDPLASHEAYWFAWSQFHPTTILWSP